MGDNIKEEFNTTPFVERGVVDVNIDAVRDNINILLTGALDQCFITPYIALERVRKVLANFHIFLPKTGFLEGERGVIHYEVKQFGEMMGMRNNGEIVTKVEHPYSLYFEYKMNDGGSFDVFSEIVNQEELDDLLDNAENDNTAEADHDAKLDEAAKEEPAKKVKYKPFLGVSPSKGNYDGQWKHSEKMNPYHETKDNIKSFKRFAQSDFRAARKAPPDFEEYKKAYFAHKERIDNIVKVGGKIKAKEKAEKMKTPST